MTDQVSGTQQAGSTTIGQTKGKQHHGLIWDVLRKAGLPAEEAPADWILSQLTETPPVVEERIRVGLEELQKGRISARKWKTLVGVLLHGLKLDVTRDELEALRTEQKEFAWKSRSVRPEFLNYVGASPSTFCLVPDSWWLPKLYNPWITASEKHGKTIEKGIREAVKLGKKRNMWLNRWKDGAPIGLWHWSWRSSKGVGLLNGGTFFMQNIWVVFTEEGAVPVVRVSIQNASSTPPGALMGSGRSDYRYEQTPWDPTTEDATYFVDGIDTTNPIYPVCSENKYTFDAA